jgi:predicted anti-sigma-YlaC factor YlaD
MPEFVCIACGQTAVTKTSHAKRCKDCRRLHHNRGNAFRMAAKRADPAFRAAEREATKLRMRRYRARRPAKPRGPITERKIAPSEFRQAKPESISP